MSEISSRIEFLLDKNNIRRADLVRATGVAEGTIRKWVNSPNPSAESLYRIAKYFDVTVEWLLTGEGDEMLSKEKSLRDSGNTDIVALNYQELKLIECYRSLETSEKNFMYQVSKLIKTLSE